MFLNFLRTIPKNYLKDDQPYPVWKVSVDTEGFYQIFEFIPKKSKYELICGRITTLDGAESEIKRMVAIRKAAEEFGKNVFYYNKEGEPVYKI